MLVLLDHRDSFTYNLAQAFQALGERVVVLEARHTSRAALLRLRPARIVLGPGPGRPQEARLALELVRELAPELPILGVCLGFQALALALGARVARSRAPLHGRAVPIAHDGRGLFCGLASPLACTRYNSLAVLERELPACLEVSARDARGELMALRHRSWPLEGVQFHPESVLSERGTELLANFLRMAPPRAGRRPRSSAATGRASRAAARPRRSARAVARGA